MMSSTLTTVFTTAGLFLFALMLPLFYRVVVGPTAIDRIVAVNVIGTKTAVLLVFIGIIFERVGMFVDFAITYALMNFIGSITVARYLHQVRLRREAVTGVSNPKPEAEAS